MFRSIRLTGNLVIPWIFTVILTLGAIVSFVLMLRGASRSKINLKKLITAADGGNEEAQEQYLALLLAPKPKYFFYYFVLVELCVILAIPASASVVIDPMDAPSSAIRVGKHMRETTPMEQLDHTIKWMERRGIFTPLR